MLTAQTRMEDLEDKLRQYNHHYYALAESLVSDDVYDSLLQELIDWERRYPEYKSAHSPTSKVGYGISTLTKVRHDKPMLSLGNVFDTKQLENFLEIIDKKVGVVDFSLEYKYDGLALSLYYVDGTLTKALTRGDGEEGEDVTNNSKMIYNIPLKLKGDSPPQYLLVNGEVVVPRKGFDLLNAQLAENGRKTYSNPRNTAAGLIRNLDSTKLINKPLAFYPYHSHGGNEDSVSDNLSYLAALGFDLFSKPKIVRTAEEIDSFYQETIDGRGNLSIDIDGLVIKVNEIDKHDILGSNSKEPKWAIAYKFPPVEKITRLKHIDWQVGRTGIVTPVGVIEPVNIGGAVIRNVSLYNAAEVKRLKLRAGSQVVVCRRGDVIPKITKCIEFAKLDVNDGVVIPSRCPACDKPISESEEGILHCTNKFECQAQLISRFRHFTSDDCMRIPGIGHNFLTSMMGMEDFQSMADIYRYADFKDKLIGPGFGIKSYENLAKAVETSKKIPLWRFINALGIISVGVETSKVLEVKFCNLDNFLKASYEEIIECESIGEYTASKIFEAISNPDTLELIELLLARGVEVREKRESVIFGALMGQTWVITGQFFKFSKGRAAEIIEANGGKVLVNPTKNITHALVGNGSGFKHGKAVKYGAIIYKEQAFLKLMETLNTSI